MTEISTPNKEIGIWGMDKTDSRCAAVSSKEKLINSSCKFPSCCQSLSHPKLSVLRGFIHLLCVR